MWTSHRLEREAWLKVDCIAFWQCLVVYWCSYQMVLKSVSRKLKLCMYKAPIGKCGHMLSMIILLVNIQLGYWFNIRSSVSRCSSYISFFSYYTIPLGTWREKLLVCWSKESLYLQSQLSKLNAEENPYPAVTWTPATCSLSMCLGNYTQIGMEFFYLYSAILKHEWLFMVKGDLFPTIQLLYNPSKEVS